MPKPPTPATCGVGSILWGEPRGRGAGRLAAAALKVCVPVNSLVMRGQHCNAHPSPHIPTRDCSGHMQLKRGACGVHRCVRRRRHQRSVRTAWGCGRRHHASGYSRQLQRGRKQHQHPRWAPSTELGSGRAERNITACVCGLPQCCCKSQQKQPVTSKLALHSLARIPGPPCRIFAPPQPPTAGALRTPTSSAHQSIAAKRVAQCRLPAPAQARSAALRSPSTSMVQQQPS